METKMTVTDTQVTVTNIEKKVADIHRDILVGQKGAPSRKNSVGEAYHLQRTERLLSPRSKPGQRYQIPYQ